MRAGGIMHVSSGFTLIELSLSIAFISVLSIIIVVLINGTISSYNRGLTLNKINTGGMDLVDELRTVMQSSKDGSVLDECKKYDKEGNSAAFDNCEQDGAKLFVSVVRKVGIPKFNGAEVPVYGAFCTGRYSYIWNSGYFSNKGDYGINDLSPATLRYSDGSGVHDYAGNEGGGYIRLSKIEDEKRAVCSSKLDDKKYETNWSNSVFDISGSLMLSSEPEEILSTDGRNELAVYYLDIAKPAESVDKKDIFYLVSMVLGTVNGGVDLSTNEDFCAASGDALANIDFCAVNKFNFAVQVNGL